ncbi:N,N'-diacetylchitobiase-like [Mytilus edulis]|uniref:N,N'-diacetylchitobiase-like n=1 Tax=Mytilus edulis TaxID=6550 RepID=UPI0039EF9C98
MFALRMKRTINWTSMGFLRKLLITIPLLAVCILIFRTQYFKMKSSVAGTGDAIDYETPQGKIDYIAQYLDVRWTVKQNLHTYAKHVLVFKNTGTHTIEDKSWKIYFHHIRIVEPKIDMIDDRYQHNILLGQSGLRVSHVSGLLYNIFPDEDLYKPLKPSEELSVPIMSSHFQLSKTDSFPNWYVTGPNLAPQIIKSTEGEELEFVSSFNHPDQWKRSQEDEHNPYTAKDRYNMSKHSFKDLAKTRKTIIPTPEEVRVSEKFVVFDASEWVILSSVDFPSEVQFLADKLAMKIVQKTDKDKFIQFSKGSPTFHKHIQEQNDEAYELRVDAELQKISITSPTSHGAFNGLQSLLSLIDESVHSKEKSLHDIHIKDRPRFTYRGHMVDLSRNFHGKETIMELLDIMAMYKLNKLHLHLSDDDGWRLQIPQIPELTKLGSNRCHDEKETICLMPSLGSGPHKTSLGSGYYTVKDYQEILKYANRRHIQIIPEIDMPSHMRAALKSITLRQQNRKDEGDLYKMTDSEDGNNYRTAQGFNDNSANPCRQGLYNFIDVVLGTLVSIHKDIQPLTLFHLGGDEVPARAMRDMKCSVNRNDIKQYFIEKIVGNTKFNELSYAVWEDGLLKNNTPYSLKSLGVKERDLYAFVWTEHHKALFKVANAGYKVVNCRGAYLYFDHPYEPDPEERGLYWATRYINTKMVFGFDPFKGIEGYGSLDKPENIVGMQSQLWTELIRTKEQFDYMTYPRLQAMAERAWHRAEWETTADQTEFERDWIKFANSLSYRELPKLDRMHVNYRLPPPGAIIKDGILHVASVFPGLPIEYSVNTGSLPLVWNRVNGGERITETISLRTLSPDGKRHSREVYVRP